MIEVKLSLMQYWIPAYVGPGLGLGAVGAVLAGILAFFAVILGFLYYPIKKMMMKFKKKKQDDKPGEEAPGK